MSLRNLKLSRRFDLPEALGPTKKARRASLASADLKFFQFWRCILVNLRFGVRSVCIEFSFSRIEMVARF
jgi:hypothetical protein